MATANKDNKDSLTDALMELLAPDGYYTYLGVPKPTGTVVHSSAEHGHSATTSVPSESEIDLDLIKKNYRKKSLKHHPDKGGDADTFRLLNRAQRVLSNPQLRKQYDILGIDLDDEEEHTDVDPPGTTAGVDENDRHEKPSSTQGIVQEIASTVLTAVIQLGVRTLMMGVVSVLLVRYWFLFYPALAFLAVIGFRIFQQHSRVPGGTMYDTLPPTLIAIGMGLMHMACKRRTWNVQFWIGESLVIALFCYNSLGNTGVQHNRIIIAAVAGFSLIAALVLRGKAWNYTVVVGFVGVLALLVAFSFPMFEMLLEAVLNEKLKKVGDKVRLHHQLLQKHYDLKAK